MLNENSDIKVIEACKIYELLDLIKRRPDLLLTSKSISSLLNYINGYLAIPYRNNMYHQGEQDIEQFWNWIHNKVKPGSERCTMYSILLIECNGDEEKAFDKFFDYLDEFKRKQV